MNEVGLIFPHQLFKTSPLITRGLKLYLVEEHLFFRQCNFHQQKLAFHRASMKFYYQFLTNKKVDVHYVESFDPGSDVRDLIQLLAKQGIELIHFIDPCNLWLENRIRDTSKKCGLELSKYEFAFLKVYASSQINSCL